jgi:hypothetical protein
MPGTYPTLSTLPEVSGWAETLANDPTIRNETDGGYTVTRARFTRLRKKFKVAYRLLSRTDKTSLETLQTTVGVGSDYFSWYNHDAATTLSVRFAGPLEFKPTETTEYWSVEFEVEEI